MQCGKFCTTDLLTTVSPITQKTKAIDLLDEYVIPEIVYQWQLSVSIVEVHCGSCDHSSTEMLQFSKIIYVLRHCEMSRSIASFFRSAQLLLNLPYDLSFPTTKSCYHYNLSMTRYPSMLVNVVSTDTAYFCE